MPRPLVECIPNFSEGRRPEIVSEIEKAIREVPEAHILDQHSDEDHNRTVITFVAPPEAAKKAAFASISKAVELIDMREHEGEHPRIGAADVVPFVPISEVTMDECVELARSLGQQVAQELDIPVYLYEKAATRPERANLENIRRGEYEGLKESIQSDSDREPDFGPSSLGPAGATVIGARAPLVAYNVYLTTDDVDLANKIARAIRHSSGGMRYVKSIGLEVDGRAQVSMNLTDYRRTPIARVQELIRREAERYGVTIHHAELVGLAPQESLIEAARWYLQLDQFEPDQILESRLYDVMAESDSGAGFLDELAEGTATPGGGSAAAHVGATAAALVAMVARLTTGKDKYSDVEGRMREIAASADELRGELEDAMPRDAAAFESVMGALRMPKSTEKEKQARAEALEAALHNAAAVPLEVAEHTTRVIELSAEVVETGNSNAITDAAAAADMAWAALRSAAYNVKINAQSVTDEQAVEVWRNELANLKERAQGAREKAHQSLAKRGDVEF
ncbi:MAG: glutamate formimidoyltransferase [Anaerolineales bacterium]|nr:glutamate formimidoyltransferase [Anaerolineales bacterium]